MTNKTLENITRKFDEYCFKHEGIMNVVVPALVFGPFVANGFYRGISDMPTLPEDRSQITIPDKIAGGILGVLEIGIIADAFTTESYRDKAMSSAGIIALPVMSGIAHMVGYVLGQAFR